MNELRRICISPAHDASLEEYAPISALLSDGWRLVGAFFNTTQGEVYVFSRIGGEEPPGLVSDAPTGEDSIREAADQFATDTADDSNAMSGSDILELRNLFQGIATNYNGFASDLREKLNRILEIVRDNG